MNGRVLAVTAVVLLAAIAPATVAATRQSGSAYAGSHVAFDAGSNALTNYTVDGTTTMESVAVQSRSEAESSVGVDVTADLAAMTDVSGAALSLRSSTSANATVATESGATLRTHDNGHGSLVVSADDEAQVVSVGLGSNASAERAGEKRVVVTHDDGTEQAFVVAGEGEVTVDDEGNVSSSIEQGSRLVVRSYANDRTDDDERQEELIANGTAAASVYLMQEDGEAVTDTVDYGQGTTVNVSERSASRVNATVSRTASQGKIVIVSASDEAFETSDDVRVSVDGEAAAQASSYAELERAADGGSSSKYVVTQSSSAEASTDVAVALNHFSSRNVTMSSDDDGSTTESDTATAVSDETTEGSADSTEESAGSTDHSDGDDESSSDTVAPSTTSGSGPGFGALGVLVALAAAAGIALRRRS